MSTHEVKVVRIDSIEKHPNADRLDLIHLFGGGFTAISRLGQFKLGDLAIYIEPDYVVPSEGPYAERFAFLEGKTRIRSRKLKSIWSQGLLIEADPGMNEGDNVMEMLGIVRYEPPMRGRFSRIDGLVQSERDLQIRDSGCVPTPDALKGLPKYDIESLRKNLHAFAEGENIIAVEKIHGANARFCFTTPKPSGAIEQAEWPETSSKVGFGDDTVVEGKVVAFDIENASLDGRRFMTTSEGETLSLEASVEALAQFCEAEKVWNEAEVESEPTMHCGSRALWKKRDDSDMWWMALAAHPWIEDFCRAFPDHVLYGEVFGQVQDLKYGAGPKDLFFRVFDVRAPAPDTSSAPGHFWTHAQLEEAFTEEQRCPVVYKGPFNFKELQKLALGDSLIPGANHLSEGIVIRPLKERGVFDPKPGQTVEQNEGVVKQRGARVVMKLVSDRYLEKAK